MTLSRWFWAGTVGLVLLAPHARAGTIDGGVDHSVAIKDDGTVWTWGLNAKGQLGDNSTTQRKTPVQIAPQPGLSNVVAVAAGQRFTVALTDAGTVWTWGDNSAGQLGDGTTVGVRKIAYQVPGLANIVAIATGDLFVLALTNDGHVWAWGDNVKGQLGTGDLTAYPSPVQVRDATGISYLSNVSAIAAGSQHALALVGTGVVAWGSNSNGQLGINTSGAAAGSTLPVQVKGNLAVGSLSDITAIAAGGFHSLAISSDTLLWAWGKNSLGQLGDGTPTVRKTPVRVKDPNGNVSGVAEVAAGDDFSLAAKIDGTAWAWGLNASGQLGQGPNDVVDRNLATKVKDQLPGTGYLTSVRAIGAGIKSSMAVVVGGNAWAWGLNGQGQLGNGATAMVVDLPVAVGGTNYVWMVAMPALVPAEGVFFSPLTVSASCITAGAKIRYTLGTVAAPPLDPTPSDSALATGATIPVGQTVVIKAKAFANLLSPSGTAQRTYVLKGTTPVVTPPGGTFSATTSVTMSTTTPSSTIRYTVNGPDPSEGSDAYAPFSLSASSLVQARTFKSGWDPSDPAIKTFTFNYGPVPNPTFNPTPPGPYPGPLSVSISAPGASIIWTTSPTDPESAWNPYVGPVVLSSSATIRAKATRPPDWTPSNVVSASYTISTGGPTATPVIAPNGGVFVAKPAVALSSATPNATIYYTLDGTEPSIASTVYAPGLNLTSTAKLRAIAIAPGFSASQVSTATFFLTGALAAGENHTLALKANGELWAWGRNNIGQLGTGSLSAFSSVPLRVASFAGTVTAISAREHISLALTTDGRVWTWGGSTTAILPTLVGSGTSFGSTKIIAISQGFDHTLALDENGEVWAWGSNTSGQLGDGTLNPSALPKKVPGLTGISKIAAGSSFSVAVKGDSVPAGAVYAWGKNNFHQLGGNDAFNNSTPRTSPGLVLDTTLAPVTGVASISASTKHTVALKADGSALIWGILTANDPMFFGFAPKYKTATPVSGLAPALSAAAGGSQTNESCFSVFVQANGIAMSWGNGQFGELGGASPIDDLQWRGSLDRVAISGDVISAATGGMHAVAVLASGELFAWGHNSYGQLGSSDPAQAPGGPLAATPIPQLISGFRLADGDQDPDHDGLMNAQELLNGTDAFDADSNDDGVLDGASVASHLDPTVLDSDGDGVSNAVELARGTSPFIADTDGDGTNDASDCFPLDPLRNQCLPSNDQDHTPPTICLKEPTNAVLVSGTNGCLP